MPKPLDQSFLHDPIAFLQQCPISPLDYTAASAHILRTQGTGIYTAPTHDQPGGAAVDATLSVKDRSKMIAFTTLEAETSARNSYKLNFRSATEVGANAGDYIPCWFLPWASNHLTRIVIPPKLPSGRGKMDPDIFFTAAINGCSVMASGDPKAPTITHGGTMDDRSNLSNPNAFQNGDAQQHWMNLFQADLAARNKNTPIHGIHKGDYVNQNRTGTTPEAVAIQNFLNSNASKTMKVQEVLAEGAVFGIRDANGNWSFYLQRKAKITFVRFKKVKHTFGPSTYKEIQVNTGKMLSTWKDGVKTSSYPEIVPEKKTVNLTINVTKFFPGGGNAAGGGATIPHHQVKAMLDLYNV